MSYKIIQLKYIDKKHSDYTVHGIIQLAMDQTTFL